MIQVTGRMRWAAVTVFWITLFVFFLYLFLPTGPINGMVAGALATQGLTLTPPARKSVVPGLTWGSPQLSSDQGVLLRFERMTVRPQLARLLAGRLAVNATAAQAGGGVLKLDATLTGTRAAEFTAEQLRLGEIPFFKTVLGAAVGGTMRCEGRAEEGKKGWNGEFKIEITGLEYVGIRMGGFSLPDAGGLQSKGMVRLADGKARLESFTIQGEGVYMRLSGELPAGAGVVSVPLNLVLEIMPKPDFLERQKLVFLLLAKFMTTPGVYRIPIRGTLLNPQIS